MLAFKTMDRIRVLEEVEAIAGDHKNIVNCKCPICQKASEAGKPIRYSPKVARVLLKGEDMTTNDVKYLIAKQVDHRIISKQTGLTTRQITEIGKKMKVNKSNGEIIYTGKELTLEELKKLKANKKTDLQICEIYGIDVGKLNEFKYLNDLIEWDLKGLTRDLYKDYKSRGLTDIEIRKQHKISVAKMAAFKKKHLTDEEREYYFKLSR